MKNKFSRFELQIGTNDLEKLAKCHVALFGVGGVGGYVCEALIRSGIGEISIIDNDVVCVSNFNRQIIAIDNEIGNLKVDALERRILSINDKVIIHKYPIFFLDNNKDNFPFEDFDYIVDAIDTVSAKISLIECAKKFNKPIICSMGAANKLNPMGFKVSDISKTKVDPLAKVMRYELKKRNIEKVKVIYSEEEPIKPIAIKEEECPYHNICKDYCSSHNSKKITPSSNAFVPSAAGLLIASEVIKDLLK